MPQALNPIPDGFVGPLSQAEYDQLHGRTDKPDLLAEVEAEANEQTEFERTDEREATQAAREAWVPIKPPYIDAHFSTWSISSSIGQSQLYLGGKMPPPVTTTWGERLRRDFSTDDYEDEMDYMRARAEAEIKYEVGELSPIRYGIHVQVASTYTEGLMVSTLAEDYYCIAGYVSWCDLSDPSLPDHLQRLISDPLLVGLRYDISDIEGDFILDQMIDNNFAAIEHMGLPFDLVVGPHQLRHVCHVAYRHPGLKIVLNHCGLPVEYTVANPGINLATTNWRSDLEFLSRYPNVFCKVTGSTGRRWTPEGDAQVGDEWCALNALSHAVSCFGPDRCIFGSGWPICRLLSPNQTGWLEQSQRATDREFGEVPGEVQAKRTRGSVPLSQLNMWEVARLVEYAMGDAGFGSVEDKYKVFSLNAQQIYGLTIRPYGSCPRQAR